MVLVEAYSNGARGLGYSYVTGAAARLIDELLAPAILGADAAAIPQIATTLLQVIRNHGRSGIGACAIAAIDIALWDLKARLLGVGMSELLGPARSDVPVYASGGFTSTPDDALASELAEYRDAGHRRVKIKIGQPAASALERARLARDILGPGIELMVDGNGAFSAKEAIQLAARLYDEHGVAYFEEPVSSDDLAGLCFVRRVASPAIAAGEYGYDAAYFRRMLDANAVDILQADATRCLGFTGFMHADAICEAAGAPLSAHCAPALHSHVARAARRIVHVEHFFDHVRMEGILFDGVPTVRDGALYAQWSRPGLGLELRASEAADLAA
jgi:L-alanine-DL-glutamate epimerase-like enolase superfamily enzyme